jgi:hypothetical protein
MKAIVVINFVDKYDNATQYMPGDIVDFDEDRIEDLERRGLVVIKSDTDGNHAENTTGGGDTPGE